MSVPRLAPRPLLLAVLLAAPAQADGPTGPFPDCAEDRREDCPSDLSWRDTSWIPDGSVDSIRDEERALGSGVGLDRALRHASGRWDVTVAVIDSGIDWADARIAGKVRLSAAETPPPQRGDGSPVPDADLDGNGILNVWDYAEDPRVDWDAGVDAADGRLDPSDLIAAFSDGVDDDGNGYVDDIAGWDFFEHDNDPYAGFLQGYSDHGTGVAHIATAWADDGGRLGACPDCSLLPLRIGEAFVTDGDRVALALDYTASNDVSSASLAIGGLSMPAAAGQAALRASRSGTVLVGAGGDENAWHRNLPASDPSFLFVKSIRADGRNEGGGATTYMATWNCNNFGPRLDLSAPASECATGATARIAGLASLVRSAARDRGIELSAARIRNLLLSTADDIAFSEAVRDETGVLPAREGWDAFHGEGRVNVGRAVEALIDGEAPPELRLQSPQWFEHASGEAIRVEGRSDVPWILEVGRGAEPPAWTEVASGRSGMVNERFTVESDLRFFADLALEDSQLDRFRRAHEPLLQIRLRASDGSGAAARTAVWNHKDSDRLPGFPLDLSSRTDVPTSVDGAPNLADVDGDGGFEIVLASASGELLVIHGEAPSRAIQRAASQPHPMAPDGLDLLEGLIGTPAVGDLDGDGGADVVVGGLAGGLYRWDTTSGDELALLTRLPRPETPLLPGVAWDNAILGSPVLADVDASVPGLEIIVGDAAQRLWVFDGEGAPLDGYPLTLCHPDTCGVSGARILASPTVADVDGDGDLDAIIATGEVPDGVAGVVHLVDLSSATHTDTLERFGLVNDTLLPVIGEGHPTSPALGDLDGDGDLELASAAMLSTDGPVHHTGEDALDVSFAAADYGGLTNLDAGTAVQMAHAPAMGDIDGDGVPDIVVGGSSLDYVFSLALTRFSDHQHGVFAWSGATGQALRGFPRQVDGPAFLTAPALADVDGDGAVDILATSTSHFLYAWSADGTPVLGFPRFHGGWAMGGPAVGDINGDGLLEVVLTTREGWVHAWRTPAPADGPTPWPRAHHDPANTGSLTTPLPEQSGLPDGTGRRCGCSSSPAGAMFVLTPVLLILGGRRRRRSDVTPLSERREVSRR